MQQCYLTWVESKELGFGNYRQHKFTKRLNATVRAFELGNFVFAFGKKSNNVDNHKTIS
jgi:hypothetical protein